MNELMTIESEIIETKISIPESHEINFISQDVIRDFVITLTAEMNSVAALGEAEIREKILNVEKYLKDVVANGIEETEVETIHHFAPDIYLREVRIPKDQLVVGKIHRYEHLNFISKGSVTVLTKDGVEHYTAPVTLISSAGTQRLLYTHEDTIWSVIHPNKGNSHDLDEIESVHIAKDFLEFPLENRIKEIEGG